MTIWNMKIPGKVSRYKWSYIKKMDFNFGVFFQKLVSLNEKWLKSGNGFVSISDLKFKYIII